MQINRKVFPYAGNKKQSLATIFEEAQMLDLLDKNFKESIINRFKELWKPCLSDYLNMLKIPLMNLLSLSIGL